jgi:hypothetical protein
MIRGFPNLTSKSKLTTPRIVDSLFVLAKWWKICGNLKLWFFWVVWEGAEN